ncbi:MAG: TetR/AcrR family transcriptional regulator [Bacillota bacterium]|nr:TetR/AcrR family transcriptional regulator [Bacillota bacterium]
MKDVDLRVKRTHKLLSESLVSLMIEKPFEKISVVDICERAMVHRATFYAHFEDKYQLLRYCMSSFEKPFDKEYPTSHDIEGYKRYYISVATDIILELEKNKALFKSLIRKNKEESLTANIRYVITDKIKGKLEKCEENSVKLPVPPEFLAHFYSGGAMNILEWWLENDMPVSSEKIIEYLDILIRA